MIFHASGSIRAWLPPSVRRSRSLLPKEQDRLANFPWRIHFHVIMRKSINYANATRHRLIDSVMRKILHINRRAKGLRTRTLSKRLFSAKQSFPTSIKDFVPLLKGTPFCECEPLAVRSGYRTMWVRGNRHKNVGHKRVLRGSPFKHREVGKS